MNNSIIKIILNIWIIEGLLLLRQTLIMRRLIGALRTITFISLLAGDHRKFLTKTFESSLLYFIQVNRRHRLAIEEGYANPSIG